MSIPEKNDVDAQEIPLEQLSEIAGGVAKDIPEHGQEQPLRRNVRPLPPGNRVQGS